MKTYSIFFKFMCLGSLDVMDTRLRFGLSGVRIHEDPKYFLPQNPQTGSYSMVKGKGKVISVTSPVVAQRGRGEL
jgi:hypothetical protein